MERRPKPEKPSLGAPLLTVDDSATQAKVSTKTVRRWIDIEDLPVVRLGRLIRIRPEDFAWFLEKRRK